jgi:hypothetical protein
MSIDQVFDLCTWGILPFWVLLAVSPHGLWTRRLVHSGLVPAAWALLYVGALALGLGSAEGGSFFSLDGVMALFQVPLLALTGWVHYLIFDLFIGAWEVREARRCGFRHAFVLPCLFLTLMAGPLGLLAFLALRLGLRGAGPREETF